MIADILMPGMNGVELARASRRARPDLPVLFVTGFGGAVLPADEAEIGGLLRKPFRSAELARKVDEMLKLGTQRGDLVRLRSPDRGNFV